MIDRYNRDSLLRTLTWEGEGVQSGVVVARKESNLKRIMDLKQRKVMFGPKASSARWAAAKLLFQESGVDIDVDLKEYSNGGCCDDIAFNVYLKAVDAGLVCDHFLSEYSMKQKELGFDARQLVVIAKTRPVPTKIFTATKNVAADIVDAINQALLSLDINISAHKKILYAAELGGFLKTDAQAFDEMKMLLEEMSTE
jgi:ABC-type phosphate/phosphonate transport system substrate-binding protein